MESLLHDVFPAEVLLPSGKVLTNVRAFVTDERIIVWQLDRQLGCKIALEFAVTELNGEPTKNSRLEVFGLTQSAIVNKGAGCGCGGGMIVLKTLPRPAEFKKEANA